MATNKSVTVSFRLNLDREEDFEIVKYLYGEGIKNSFGGKSKFIKDTLLRVLRGMKRDEENKRIVSELNAQRVELQQTMIGEADRIINVVKLIVEEQVKGLTVMETENSISQEKSQTTPGENEDAYKVSEEFFETLDDDIADYAMSFL